MQVIKWFVCFLIFLFCACAEKPKESAAPQEAVQPDTASARGESEKMGSVEDLQLSIYPNPARDDFYLELNEIQGDMRYFIMSSAGPIVQYGDIRNLKENIEISKLQDGIYTIKVISSNRKKPTETQLIVRR